MKLFTFGSLSPSVSCFRFVQTQPQHKQSINKLTEPRHITSNASTQAALFCSGQNCHVGQPSEHFTKRAESRLGLPESFISSRQFYLVMCSFWAKWIKDAILSSFQGLLTFTDPQNNKMQPYFLKNVSIAKLVCFC